MIARIMKRISMISLLLLLPWLSTQAFVVKRIEVVGSGHLSSSIVRSLVPVKVGQNMDSHAAIKTIRSLYASGYFSDVRLAQRGNTLVVAVKERALIGVLSVSGNEAITAKQLKPVFKKLGLVEGQAYNPLVLKQVELGLRQQYQMMGYYAAKITSKVKSQRGNRVSIKMQVKEGPIAKIRAIDILGNNAFNQRALLKKFKLSSSGLFSFFTHSDRYSEYKLDADLISLRNYYLNYGYIQFQIAAKKVDISKDNKHVTIHITLNEGPVYRIGSVKLLGKDAGDAAVKKRMTIRSGEVFSRGKILAVDKSIAAYFRNRGYALPNILVKTNLNNSRRVVNLVFNVYSGQRVYVRRIFFTGATSSEDVVLRSRMKQMEGALYSEKNIQESKRKLANLPYYKNIKVKTIPVAGHPDQVDLDFDVTEVHAGQLMLKAGYAGEQGFLYGFNIFEQNFLGTGNILGLTFQHSQLSTNYMVTFGQPKYTIDGISRSISLNYTKTDTLSLNMAPYNQSDAGVSLGYGIPISDNNTISVGAAFDQIKVTNYNGSDTLNPAPNVVDFMNNHKSPFNQFKLTTGWSNSNYDHFPFPNSGSSTSLTVDLGAPIKSMRSLGYYKTTFSSNVFHSLGHGFILNPHVNLGYGAGFGGDKTLAFYNNFYAGGPTTLPGYAPNALGPYYDAAKLVPGAPGHAANSLYLGGNEQILGGVNLIFPNGISNSVRTSLFVDAGNVFETNPVHQNDPLPYNAIQYEKASLKNLRVTAGVMLQWNIPMLGPLQFSLGWPLNKKKGDLTQVFGFSFGAAM
jgi:outer membrane protein insertion porin family